MSERGGSEDSGAEGAKEERKTLRVGFASKEALAKEYSANLAHGALFLPTDLPYSAGDGLRVILDFSFCDKTLVLYGDVVSVVSSAMAKAGATPGVSIQFKDNPRTIATRIEETTGLNLTASDLIPPDERRESQRFPARTPVRLDADGRHFPAETMDVSYTGMLALLQGLDLPLGTELNVTLSHPQTEEEISVAGKVANQSPCDNGYMATGIQFLYSADRIDEVMAFIDHLRAFHHANQLARVTGALSESPLDSILETFASVSNQGTLNLSRNGDEGRIGYQDGNILYAYVGLVSGVKALTRMFTWDQGQFEFQTNFEATETQEPPIPLQAAILEAAVHCDEIARLDLTGMESESTFEVDEEKLADLKPRMSKLAVDVAEYAAMGFTVDAILDVVTDKDAQIYETLVKLRDSGILKAESS